MLRQHRLTHSLFRLPVIQQVWEKFVVPRGWTRRRRTGSHQGRAVGAPRHGQNGIATLLRKRIAGIAWGDTLLLLLTGASGRAGRRKISLSRSRSLAQRCVTAGGVFIRRKSCQGRNRPAVCYRSRCVGQTGRASRRPQLAGAAAHPSRGVAWKDWNRCLDSSAGKQRRCAGHEVRRETPH